MPWTVRFRFRVSKALTSDAMELTTAVGGRQGVISGEPDKPLKESKWLTLNFHGLEDESFAREFGGAVLLAVFLAAARQSIGIDAGEDKANSGFGQIVIDALAKQGIKAMPNVHGLLVYEREGNELFAQFNGSGRVTTDPDIFLNNLTSSFSEASRLPAREITALSLLGLANIATEPLAEAVLCISAVEFLSNEKPWSSGQFALLAKLQGTATASVELPQNEAQEVAEAVKRAMKASIRQSIKRKMQALGMTGADWKVFDEVYNLRSGIFHGLITGRDRYGELATKAREICSRIVLAAVNSWR